MTDRIDIAGPDLKARTQHDPSPCPAWCSGAGQCDAAPSPGYEDMRLGEHVSVTARMRSIYGVPIEIGLVEAADEPGRTQVLLALPFDTRNMLGPGMTEEETNRMPASKARWLGQSTYLEPEEARMLARFLLEAAQEWERLAASTTAGTNDAHG